MTEAIETVAESLPLSQDQKQQIGEKASEVQTQVKDSVSSELGRRANQAGQQVSTVAQALRSSGQAMRSEGQSAPAAVLSVAADRVDDLAGYLSESDPQQILDDVENFLRQQPWVALMGGLVLGVAGARLLKSSSTARYSARSTAYSSGATPLSNGQAVTTYGPDYDYPAGAYASSPNAATDSWSTT